VVADNALVLHDLDGVAKIGAVCLEREAKQLLHEARLGWAAP
jgi:hypothetical protein